jgi:murein DD-endopeptidase MepM/ murein hydrolase activator NlpD
LIFFVLPVYADKSFYLTPTSSTSQHVWYNNSYNLTAVRDGKLLVGGWGDIYITQVRYDLSPMPLSAIQASLWFWYTPPTGGATPTPIDWYKITGQWNPSTVGWNTMPSFAYVWTTSSPSSTTAGWYAVDITYEYNQWRKGIGSNLNYGFLLAPYYNNNRFDSFVSPLGSTNRPFLKVTCADPTSSDYIIHLKWPLASPSYGSRYVTQPFGVNWAGGTECPVGVPKKHNGTDFRASAGTVVYAPEDGIIKDVIEVKPWGFRFVMEHNKPLSNNKYTTVIWHITPDTGVRKKGLFIPKGMRIGVIANIASGPHLHLGLRIGSYNAVSSGTGALPQSNCTDPNSVTYPAFPDGFVDVNKTTNVIFQ